LTSASSLAGLEEVAIHLGRHHRSGLHPEVVAEQDDVDGLADGTEKAVQVLQVDLHELVEEGMGSPRFGRQHHHELVVAVAELADLEEIAAEEADDGPVGLGAELSGALLKRFGVNRSGRAGDGGPHGFVECLAHGGGAAGLGQGVVELLEVQRPVGHVGEDRSAVGAYDPTVWLPFDVRPCRHEARRPIRQRPGRPVLVTECKPAPEFDGIDAKSVEDVLVHDGQLLDDVVDPDGFRRKAQKAPQLRIGQCGDTGGPVPGQVDGHTIRRTVVKCGEDAISCGHG